MGIRAQLVGNGPGKTLYGRKRVSSLPGYLRIVTFVAPAAGSVPPPVLPLESSHAVAPDVGIELGSRARVAPAAPDDPSAMYRSSPDALADIVVLGPSLAKM